MASQAEIGLIGLGVMGQNLALNIADHGFHGGVQPDSRPHLRRSLRARTRSRPIASCATLADLVGVLRTPRAIILMVQAGAATDDQIAALALLAPGDVIVDGGNARYQDTLRRERALGERAAPARHRHLGRRGGRGTGHRSWRAARPRPMRVQPIFEAIAAQVDGAPCCARLGPDGAGHFVKMLHNGIEYADMQLIAEIYALMKDGLGLAYPEMQGDLRGVEPGRPGLVPDRDHGRHPRQARSRDRPADGRGDPRSPARRAPEAGRSRRRSSGRRRPSPRRSPRGLSAAKDERVYAAPRLAGPAAGEDHAATVDLDTLRACAPRRQGRGVRPGLRGHGGGQLRTRLGTRSRHHRADLARRLHHPRAPAQSHARGVRA